MEDLRRYLSEHPFFSGMSQAHLDLMVGCASNVKFDAGQYIDRAGELANYFYIIRVGKVAVEMYHPAAGAITIQTVGEGDIVGWSFLFPPFIGHFDSIAVDLTRAIALDGACLRKKVEDDHELGYELYRRFAQIMEQRLENTRVQLLDLYK
ncbi:MAG: cyclic nucleotide-binding domain-containing protein [Candidatus Zixiibacteriota bacterium]|jgi:CRP/FNR family transcriptional regulator, cyclic AMP receptor protein